jgi:STE24 endopeptidase
MEKPGGEKAKKAKRYARLNYWLTLVNFTYLFAYLAVILGTGLSSAGARLAVDLAGPGPAAQALYIAGFVVLTTVVLMPLSFYRGYLIEHRFELSNQTPGGWLSDEAKGLALAAAIFTPLGLAAYRLLAEAGPYWWVWAAALWTLFGFVLAYLAPVLIMPIFNKYEPIESEILRRAVLKLADEAAIAISDVLRTDLSKRTKKANAFFAGLGNTKRIVLGDTLLESFTQDEILTVVAHEMGHWKLGHLWKGTAVNVIGSLAGFYLADRFLAAGVAYLGLPGIDDIAGLPLILLAFMILGLFTLPASNALSRRFERQADRFELELVGQPEAAISTFNKLAEQNLSDPSPHPIIEFLLYSHPSIAKRVAMAEGYRK